MSFAENLVYLRQHYGVTQEGLAEQVGVSRQTVSKWEAGTNYPEMEKLLILCDLFHVSMDDLMRGAVSVAKEGDTEGYDRHMNRYDLAIACGVAIILIGVAVSSLFQGLGMPENLESAAFLAFVVVGVMLFIVGGLSHAEFKRRNPTIEPRYDAKTLEHFGRRFPVMIAIGVGLILIDVIFLVALSPDDSSLDFVRGINVEELLMTPFMLIMAAAVGLLIWAGMQKSKYNLSELTYIAHRRDLGVNLPSTVAVKSPERVRAERIMGVICGCIMLLATIVFLVWGFSPMFDQIGWDGMDKHAYKDAIRDAVRSGQGGFAVSWISFVVGGILCGVVYLIGSVFAKSKEDWIAEARQEDAWLKYAQSDEATNDPWARTNTDVGSETPLQPDTPRSTTNRTWK